MSESTVEIKQYGNGHVVRYYALDGEMRVTEMRNGHTLDLSLQDYLHADAWELVKYFALGPQSTDLKSGPTSRGTP